MKFAAIALLAMAWAASAANLDGKWAVEMTPGGKKGGVAKSTSIEFDLKSQESQLTGSVAAAKGKHARQVAFQDGKIDGDTFTFTTVKHGKKGDVKFSWQGTLKGEQIRGTRSKEGAKHGTPFIAKRQG
jgi:hypothetical protein